MHSSRTVAAALTILRILFGLPGVGLAPVVGWAEPAVTAFSTGGHTVYHLRSATVDRNSAPVVVSAAYDGSVLCHTPAGVLRWQAETGGNFPFDLCVADIDGDGRDETLVASADGALYVIGPDGKRLWTFQKTPPLFQVCAAREKDGKCIILTGGVEQILYALTPDGKLLRQLPMGACIRHVRAGDILGEGRDMVAVATATSGLNGALSLSLVDPRDLRRIWTKTDLGSHANNSGRRFFSMAIVDLDHDGKQDIMLSGSWGEHGRIFAFDQAGNLRFTQSDPRIPEVPYRMNLLVPVKLPHDEYVIGQFGNILITYNLDGSCREVVTGSQAYANGAFDPTTQTLYCGSEVSGGDEILAVRLAQPGWQRAFADAKPMGKLAKIEANLEILRAQIARFQRPTYQPEPRGADLLLMDEYHLRSPEELRPPEQAYQKCRFVSHIVLGQKPEADALWCRVRSTFCRYDLTADELVEEARKWEASGRDFILGSGHGRALHMAPATFERVLQAAPKHLWGFEFSEIGQARGSQEQEIVEKILLPLADQCRKFGHKKILLRTKNIFWNGNVYLPYWQGVLLNARYCDIFVPCLEETNCRSQELSLAGRVGLWLSGAFDHWACRAETDNACFDRMWEWSSQQVLSHHLRNLVSCASLGSDIYFNSVHQGPFSAALERQLRPFYEMIEKGVVHIPQRADLVSISDVALGMRSPPAAAYLDHGNNGHRYTYPRDQHPTLVFDRLDAYWAAAPLAPHDFSRYVFGVQRRMGNFLPLFPYGMVPIVPDLVSVGSGHRFQRKISTDGQYFYDARSQPQGPTEYRSHVEATLQEAAARLPLRVRGPAHWSAARLDARHLRVTLVDPGYLDPDDRDVEIVLQQPGWTRCQDILANEELPIRNHEIPVRIPMGSVRIIDLRQD